MEDLHFVAERQKCGTAEIGRPERSEREMFPSVTTTVLFGFSLLNGLTTT